MKQQEALIYKLHRMTQKPELKKFQACFDKGEMYYLPEQRDAMREKQERLAEEAAAQSKLDKNPMQVMSQDEFNEYRSYFLMREWQRKRLTNEDFKWIDLEEIRSHRT